ncbi:MAG: tape measure protein [Thiobacillus sp.]|nr:tape measure protein [Thiobacillus sp.]
MADQKLLYTIEGDASGLKKAMAESDAAYRKLTDALTRKGVEIAALKSAEADLKKIDIAAAEAKRQMDFFRRSAETAPGGMKAFSKDIDKASKDLARLTQQSIAQRAKVAGLGGSVASADTGVVAAEEALANANAQKRVALLEAERQARVEYGKQVLAGLQAQAAETERVAAIERRRAADEAAATRAAAANARVRAAAQQSAAQAAQSADRLRGYINALPRFDLKGNAAAKLAEINAAAAKSKAAFNDALTAARNFGRGGASAAQGFGGQLKSLALQALGVTAAIKGIGAVVDTGIASQRLDAKFQFAAAGDTAQAASDLAFVRAESDRLALSLPEAADGFSKLASSTMGTQVEGEKTRKIFTGISSAMRVLGAPTYQVERAFNAVTQAISKGNLQAEEIRGQLGESIPGAFRIMANALGMTMEELDDNLKKGAVNGAEAMVKFAAELERLSQAGLLTATNSFQAQMVRLSNTLFDFRDMIADAGLLDALGDQITGLTEKLREMADTGELQQFASDFAQVIGSMASILGTATRLVIEHRDALATLAMLYAGFKIAKGVQGVAIAWGAATTALLGTGTALVGVAAKARILLALLGGPVGITVAILSAAAAWLTFGKDATSELDAVIDRQKKLNALQGKGERAAVDDRDLELATLKEQLQIKRNQLEDATTGLVRAPTHRVDKLREDVRLAESAVNARSMKLYLDKANEAANANAAPAAESATAATVKPGKVDKGALSAAKQEAAALLKAQEALDKALADAAAQGLEDSLTARRESLELARKGELIDEATFIRAKAMLAEEGLRNELAALQAQQAKLRAAAGDSGAKASDRREAEAELTTVEARIKSAEQKIANLGVATRAELDILDANALNAKTKAQDEFLEGLEQEAFLSSLSNDERETALLLLEAEKNGITDINRLLELQRQIRQAANDRAAAEETKRQQDELYASVQQGVQKAFADGLNAIATGEGGIRGALQGVVDMLRNALGNAIAGSLTESFMGMLGGKDGVLNIAGMFGFGTKESKTDEGGGLFGLGGKKGETPTNPLYVKDVAAGGGVESLLGGVEGESGGMFAGFFDGIKTFFSSLTSGLSNLFSGLASSLSGLFSGGGGGGGNVGGWVSAIAGMFGFAEGGWTGPGTKYQPAGVVHAGEYVFSADSVRRLGLGALDNLHSIAKGSMIPRGPRLGYAEGGLVSLPGSAAPNVTSNTKVVNMFDLDSALAEYLNTRGGERAILNVIQRNPGAASA